jgi:hypothetical protein
LHSGAGQRRSRREAGDGRQEHQAARGENASRLNRNVRHVSHLSFNGPAFTMPF